VLVQQKSTSHRGGNFNHGAFLSGDRLHQKLEAVTAFLELQNEEFFATMSESIALDRGIDFSPDMVHVNFQTWMEANCIKNRGHFATRLTQQKIHQVA